MSFTANQATKVQKNSQLTHTFTRLFLVNVRMLHIECAIWAALRIEYKAPTKVDIDEIFGVLMLIMNARWLVLKKITYICTVVVT